MIAVNLTIMLVMTTIFTSKIEELPPTSDHICEPEEADKDKDKAGKEEREKGIDLVQEGSSGAWALTGAKVAPQQVKRKINFVSSGTGFGPGQGEKTKKSKSKNGRLALARGRCWTGAWKRSLEITGFLVDQGIKDLTFWEL